MIKHTLLVLLTFTTFLSGCLGPKKIDQWADNHYGESVNVPPKMKSDYISITSGLITDDPKASSTAKQTKNLLPLIFYWQLDYMTTCTLNPKIPINTFRSTVQSYANSKGLRQKLNGQKIELTIDKIPNIFVMNDRGHLIWIIYAFAWDNITFQPDNQEMVVSYKIKKDNIETKNGVVTIPNTDKVLQLRYLQSLKKATGQYLDQYDENIKSLSKKAVDKIITEL